MASGKLWQVVVKLPHGTRHTHSTQARDVMAEYGNNKSSLAAFFANKNLIPNNLQFLIYLSSYLNPQSDIISRQKSDPMMCCMRACLLALACL